MKFEQLDPATRKKLIGAHRAMTHAALVQVIGLNEADATKTIRDLWQRYETAPQIQQDLLLHNDPLALACNLAERSWESLSRDKVENFNAMRRGPLEQGLGVP